MEISWRWRLAAALDLRRAGAAAALTSQRPRRSDRRCEPGGPGICLDQQRLEPAAVRRARLSRPGIRAQGAEREGAHLPARPRSIWPPSSPRSMPNAHQNPAGVIVVGGWDDALASEVDKCIDKKVPTVVTDGDLPISKRLTYLGTNWYNLGYQHGLYQCRYHNGGRVSRAARSARSRCSPRATSSPPARACATRSPRNARTSRWWPMRNPAPMSSRWRPTPRPSSRAIRT